MRIGIDAHIVLPKHKRYDPKIARYTEQLIWHVLEADKNEEHTWVLFFDSRMPATETKKFERQNVEIKRFPFVQYRRYLPVIYGHMLISSFLAAARLDVFHSPEGLIPFLYPGNIVTTFHYVPQGQTDSNVFVKTFMFGAKAAFAQLCKRARRILVNKPSDKGLLVERHGYPAERVVVMENEDIEELLAVYADVVKSKGSAARLKKIKNKKKKSSQ